MMIKSCIEVRENNDCPLSKVLVEERAEKDAIISVVKYALKALIKTLDDIEGGNI